MRGTGEGGIDEILVADVPIEAGVAGGGLMHQRRAGRDGVGDVGDGGQVLIVDDQQFGGIACLLPGLGDHRHHRVTDMAHAASGQHRVAGLDHRGAILGMDLPATRHATDAIGIKVGMGENRHHTGCGAGCTGVDGCDDGMRAVRAFENAMGLAGTVHVVGIVAATAEEPQILFAANGGADAFENRVHCSLPELSARGSPRAFVLFGR